MLNLIPISLLISAIGGILYIISNHLSELNGDDKKADDYGFHLKARFINWVNQLPMDNLKDQSLSLTQKTLHRMRLLLLKSDNILMKLIGKISKQKTANGNNGTHGTNGADNTEDLDKNFWENIVKDKQEESYSVPIAEPEVKIDLAIKSEAAKKFFDIKPAAKKTLKIKKFPK